jgi:hypothetical protein
LAQVGRECSRTHSLVLRLAGAFKPSKKLYREAEQAQELTVRLFERVKVKSSILLFSSSNWRPFRSEARAEPRSYAGAIW